jgi:phosphoribosylamine--glycine ligase
MGLTVLLVGGGGREHALAWKIRQSPLVSRLIAAPGNPGIAEEAELFPVAADDARGLSELAEREKADLVVAGPEAALVAGLADLLEVQGIPVFGPKADGARLEGSKVFMKEILSKCGIPTAPYRVFDDYDEAEQYVLTHRLPVVVKADGLAAGKGVAVASTFEEALDFLRKVMVERVFGDAGDRVVIEECLPGEEASYLVFTDGKDFLPLPSSQDHKRIGDGDSGPNTGGMGAYSPAPVVTDEVDRKVRERVIAPLLAGLRAEGIDFRGILYAGLMIEDGEPRVLEFNVRFGDPEAQPLLFRLKGDVVPVLMACAKGDLDGLELEVDPRPTVCVVMASAGYPGEFEKGVPIHNISAAEEAEDGLAKVFHAGTAWKDDRLVNAGGRVLGVTAVGETLAEAIARAYRVADAVDWPNGYCRRDIGKKALDRSSVEGRGGR